MPIIHVPEVLRDKLGPEGARALVDLFNQTGRETRDDVITLVEERFNRRLAEEIGKVRQELAALGERLSGLEIRVTERLTAFETRFSERLAALDTGFDARLKARIATAQTRLLLWTFAFWVSLMATLLVRT